MSRAATRETIGIGFTAALAFSLLFAGTTSRFWLQLPLTVAGLCGLALLAESAGLALLFRTKTPGLVAVIAVGLASALLLYGVFWVGNVASRALWPAAAGQIDGVYDVESRGSRAWIVIVLLFVGPGEEVFWRGFFQTRCERALGPNLGMLATALLYAGVHVASRNVMLIGAALVCGLFWGVLFRRFRSIWMNMISHTLWDLLVFVLWPLGGRYAEMR